MSKTKREHPTQDEFDQLSTKLRDIEENGRRTFKEATEFKSGELIPEEEKFVRQATLNALNYSPQ